MTTPHESVEDLLHEGLNLCVRARELDDAVMAKHCRELGSYHPDHANCITPHIWPMKHLEVSSG